MDADPNVGAAAAMEPTLNVAGTLIPPTVEEPWIENASVPVAAVEGPDDAAIRDATQVQPQEVVPAASLERDEGAPPVAAPTVYSTGDLLSAEVDAEVAAVDGGISTDDLMYPREPPVDFDGGDASFLGGSNSVADAPAEYARSERSAEEFELSCRALFGEHFHPDLGTVVDPREVDSRLVVQDIFGVDESIIVPEQATSPAALEAALRRARALDARTDVEIMFGRDAPDCLSTRSAADGEFTFGILHATAPLMPHSLRALQQRPPQEHRKTLLVQLAKQHNNKQTLHVEPLPYDCKRSSAVRPLDTDRAVYTPSNVIRWAIQQEKGLALSNARIVRWSDGTSTLHVGKEVFDIAPSQQHSLSLLTVPHKVHKNSVVIDSLCHIQPYDGLYTVSGRDTQLTGAAILHEGVRNRATRVENRVSFPIETKSTRVGTLRRASELTDEEAFVLRERERLAREQKERVTQRRPMSLIEKFAAEVEMREKLDTMDAHALRQQQELDQRNRALASGSGGGSHKRHRREAFDGEQPESEERNALGPSVEKESWAAIVGSAKFASGSGLTGDRDADEDEVELPQKALRTEAVLEDAASPSVRPPQTVTAAASLIERACKAVHLLVSTALPADSKCTSYLTHLETLFSNASSYAEQYGLTVLRAELKQVVADVHEAHGGDVDCASILDLLREL